MGYEDFDHPATKQIMARISFTPDVIHLHNLHGAYFDLRELERLSAVTPVGITLHDQWMLTGHCAYSFECERWQVGCGSCPHLDTYPSIPRDATRLNLARKARIYQKSELHVSAPSKWLLDQVTSSVLAQATSTLKHLPYGVDQEIFRPGDKAKARAALGVPSEASVILFAANRGRANQFKDWGTVAESLAQLQPLQTQVVAYAIGDPGHTERLGHVIVHFLPGLDSPTSMAKWYRAADLFLHAARADNFPLTILEALSCGTPVVATATGGIPEQIVHLGRYPGGIPGGSTHHLATGVLTPHGDGAAMAQAVGALLSDRSLLSRMGQNAAQYAAAHYSLERYVNDTLAWYSDLAQSSSLSGERSPPHEQDGHVHT